eukprot:CAMPEP_0115678148 /NCGR_PEP_ID=MMETSP0272-20121206/55598_1 /TAXON_ID=71861 /ORGANISM="Scrippsiella trochoidea, Strain CCMP3099" /LENGTH=270 /DNA_ID=CAMNT_0003117301 /DNA_START=43 /DNA_END=855 /DNA_ORIENTATION=-
MACAGSPIGSSADPSSPGILEARSRAERAAIAAQHRRGHDGAKTAPSGQRLVRWRPEAASPKTARSPGDRPEMRALANGQCVQRARTCFPSVRRKRMEDRDPDQVSDAKAVFIRFGMEPTPRHLGGDPCRLEMAEDRGTVSTVETVDLEAARGAAAAARAIRCLPRDHVEFERRRQLHADVPMLSHMVPAIVERGPEQELGRHRVPLKQSAHMFARQPLVSRAGCGFEALRARRGDPELWEVQTPAPAHLCGSGPLFPAHYSPRRGAALP